MQWRLKQENVLSEFEWNLFDGYSDARLKVLVATLRSCRPVFPAKLSIACVGSWIMQAFASPVPSTPTRQCSPRVLHFAGSS